MSGSLSSHLLQDFLPKDTLPIFKLLLRNVTGISTNFDLAKFSIFRPCYILLSPIEKKKYIYIERENQLFFPMLIVRGFKKIKQKRSIFALSTKALIMRELLVYDKYWLDKFKSKKAKATKCLWVS